MERHRHFGLQVFPWAIVLLVGTIMVVGLPLVTARRARGAVAVDQRGAAGAAGGGAGAARSTPLPRGTAPTARAEVAGTTRTDPPAWTRRVSRSAPR
jgi:hypothetical protein